MSGSMEQKKAVCPGDVADDKSVDRSFAEMVVRDIEARASDFAVAVPVSATPMSSPARNDLVQKLGSAGAELRDLSVGQMGNNK